MIEKGNRLEKRKCPINGINIKSCIDSTFKSSNSTLKSDTINDLCFYNQTNKVLILATSKNIYKYNNIFYNLKYGGKNVIDGSVSHVIIDNNCIIWATS